MTRARGRLETALVTGASAGIGRELVRQLVMDRGMTVLATARRRDRLAALADELPAGRVLIEAGDVTDPEFRGRLWARAEAMPGGCDLVVNNAGLGHFAEFADQPAEAIERMLSVNLTALMDLTQKAIGHMRARGSGQICEMSSVVGSVGLPYQAVYAATKHFVNGLVKCLRYELRGTGVRIWAACPARTVSEFQAVARGLSGESLATAERFGVSDPVETLVQGIVRGLDSRRAFIYPTSMSATTVRLSSWLPLPWDYFMARLGPAYFRKEMGA
jgi:short-subunit dehydrogenase